MTQTTAPATVQYCHDIFLDASKKDILQELISLFKELKARHSFGFLWKVQRLEQSRVPTLRVWTLHGSESDAEMDLNNLNYQLTRRDTSMIMVEKPGKEYELGTSRRFDMAIVIDL